MANETYSPAALLLIHIEDECLFGETELVFPLSSIVVQSFDCTLKHSSEGHRQSVGHRADIHHMFVLLLRVVYFHF